MSRLIELCKRELLAPRIEKGYFLDVSDLDDLRLCLTECGYKQDIYESPWVLTVYFAERSLKTTQNGYVRARQYMQGSLSEVVFDKYN